MIQPSSPYPQPVLFAHPRSPLQIPARSSAERPIESLPAPHGGQSELLLHHRLIQVAEREFARILDQIEPLLQPLA